MAASALSAAALGAPLGARATLVQFSTEVCAYCGPTRQLLTEVAGERDGVAFVEIDAAGRMDLTRRLHVLSPPTLLVVHAGGGRPWPRRLHVLPPPTVLGLGAAGAITSRASGPVRRAALLTAVGQ